MKNLVVRYIDNDEFEKWDSFVDSSPQGNIFNKSYWLKSVSDDFKILVCEENNMIVGGIVLNKKLIGVYGNPKLTPQLGILMAPPGKKDKYSTILSKEMAIANALIDNFPNANQVDFNFSYNYTNYLPFIWNGYDIKVKYTYVIEDLTNLEEVHNDFQYDVKYLIKKAAKNEITVTEDYDIEDFYNINMKTFQRQNEQMPYTLEFIKKLDDTLKINQNRKILFAVNKDKKIVGAAYLLYDKECTYYLMGGADPKYRNLGVQTLLVWEGIKFASTVSKKFDFEGSMIKNIEKSFRQFGGTQKIIYNVYKSNMTTKLLYAFARKNKNIIRKLFKV